MGHPKEDRLRQFLEQFKWQKWIPVKDRLPHHGDMVLVQGGCAFWDGQWRTMMEDHWPPIRWDVTHWMPFPSNPPNVT